MLETAVGILIVLFILGLSFLIAYWGLYSLWKVSKKRRRYENAELKKELSDLKQQVKVLEKEKYGRWKIQVVHKRMVKGYTP
ncbi:LapA family protein [Bacillus sp. NTK074B]|uniref:LapA family protein n=1 Tax=Bacillus sp. NTK074B TaxID=2802174 RepID=UPI001A8F2984|nr:LapA family protein [Bacillus sp. NTK074B]